VPRYAAFLRGINVGGRRIAAAALCAPFERMGLESVTSFRASGNVVFDASAGSRSSLAKAIEGALEDGLGYDVATFLRTGAELRALAAHEPFPAGEIAKGRLHVAMLDRKPAAAVQDEVLALAGGGDRLAFGPRELWWLTPGMMRDSGIDWNQVGKLVGRNTMRTKGTIEQMTAKYFA
jgi:uncharacterized protein (DUF1697 family)